jgi:hypothetical protein
MQTATMKALIPPVVCDNKQVEMTKLRKFVPDIEKANPIYKTPEESIIQSIKAQNNQKVQGRTKKNKRAKEESKNGKA